MISHLELVLQRVLELVGGWMCALAITLVVAIAAVAFLGLNLYKFDRESCLVAMRRLSAVLSRGWGWVLAACVLLIQVYGLKELHTGLVQRIAQEGKARYVANDDPGGLPTTQRAPQVAILDTTTTTQRIVLPPNLTSLEALPNWNPEEARFGGNPAVNVQDELVKDDKAIVLNRTTHVQRYVPTKLLRSEVEINLDFQNSRKRQVYVADFLGRYTFQNPHPGARKMHFSFPLPDNSGTLSSFHFKVNGVEFPASDVERGLDWETELKPGERATVEIGYKHRGARSWGYDVAGRREPIADFHLTVRSDKSDIKFQRGSLYPTEMTSGTLVWNLKNQISSQSVRLFFPYVAGEQVISNLFVFAPVSLLSLAVLAVSWARLRRTRTSSWALVLATMSLCCGYSLASYLLSYVPLPAALVFSFAATFLLQWHALGRRLAVPVAATTIAPFTFLAAGHTGLLLSLLGLAVLTLTVRETCKTQDQIG